MTKELPINYMDWVKYGYVMRSKYRRLLLSHLFKTEATPTELATRQDIHKSHVSRTLKDLVEAGLIECLNPGSRMGKVFGLTDSGREVASKIVEKRKQKAELESIKDE